MILSAAAFLSVIAAWAYMNRWYRRIHGAPLRWRYMWAAHGAVLFMRRYPEWERRPPVSGPVAGGDE